MQKHIALQPRPDIGYSSNPDLLGEQTRSVGVSHQNRATYRPGTRRLETTMTESDLITAWGKARGHIIAAQAAPTFLLTAVIGFLAVGLATADPAVRIATAGILLASGILGALAQIAAANEGRAVIADLRALDQPGSLAQCIVAMGRWVNVVRFVTPAIFVVVYIALLAALFLGAP